MEGTIRAEMNTFKFIARWVHQYFIGYPICLPVGRYLGWYLGR